MNNPNYVNWSREAKEKYAEKRMEEMRLKNEQLQRRHAEVEGDRLAAEGRNSSVTNSTKGQKESSHDNVRTERASRNTTRPIREWDRGKLAEQQGFHRYRTSPPDRRHYRNDNWAASRDDQHWHDQHKHDQHRYDERRHDQHRHDEHRHDRVSNGAFIKKSKRIYKSYHNDQHNRSSQHQSFEPSSNRQSQRAYDHQSHEKYKKSNVPPASKKHHSKYNSSSSSTDPECEDNKMGKENTKDTTLWPSDRLSEDQTKFQRTEKWVVDVAKSSLEPETAPTEEDVKNTSPKRKFDRFETASDKCLNDNDLTHNSSIQPKQMCSLKSRKIEYRDGQTNYAKEDKIIEQKVYERKKKNKSESYSKFDRFDRSDKSSEDSDSLELCGLATKHIKRNLYSEKLDCNEKESSQREIIPISNLKSSTDCYRENQAKRGELSNEDRRDVEFNSNNKPFNIIKGPSNTGFNPNRKVSSSSVGHSFPKESSYNNRGFDFDNTEKFPKPSVKGSKTKRNPQYNAFDSSKNEHFSKQRRFDKEQSGSDLQKNNDKGLKREMNKSNKKKPGFDVDEENIDGWGNIAQTQDDDGIWGSAEQSGTEWKINENEDNVNEKAKFASDGRDTCNIKDNTSKAFKVKEPGQSDDGGWSTVEEGEIRSDDESEKK